MLLDPSSSTPLILSNVSQSAPTLLGLAIDYLRDWRRALNPRPFRTLTLAGLVALVATSLNLSAQAQDLPTGDEVLSAYIEATGGVAAYNKATNRRSTGTIEFVGAGISGDTVILEAAPNKILITQSLDQIGKIVQGYNGETAWEMNPITGNRLIEGDEKAVFVRDGIFNSELKWKELYSKVEVTGTDEVEGDECYVVTLTPKEGNLIESYYSKESGLLVKNVFVASTPMGEIEVEQLLQDYLEFDGVKVATKLVQKVLGNQFVITIENVETNIELPEDVFEVPDDFDL